MTCPRSRHSFLHAQSGLFTWILGADRFFLREGRYPTVEDALAEECGTVVETPMIFKLVLAEGEVLKLRKMLFLERVSRAHLMPTLDNVTAAAEMELLWSSEGDR
jgi:hypothetical protein